MHAGEAEEREIGWIQNEHENLGQEELDEALGVYASSVYEPDGIEALAKALNFSVSREANQILDKRSPISTR